MLMLGKEGADWSYDISESFTLFFLIAIDIMVFYTASSGFRSYILAFFNLASMAIFKASIFIYHTHQYTIGIGMLFFNAHVVGGWWEALLDDGRIVALQTDACPWELYPDPTFIIVICGDTFYCLLWLHGERCLDLLCSHINLLLHLLSYLALITIFINDDIQFTGGVNFVILRFRESIFGLLVTVIILLDQHLAHVVTSNLITILGDLNVQLLQLRQHSSLHNFSSLLIHHLLHRVTIIRIILLYLHETTRFEFVLLGLKILHLHIKLLSWVHL